MLSLHAAGQQASAASALLREMANIPQDRLLDLSQMKLKEKVSATSTLAEKKQLEREARCRSQQGSQWLAVD